MSQLTDRISVRFTSDFNGARLNSFIKASCSIHLFTLSFFLYQILPKYRSLGTITTGTGAGQVRF